MLNVAEIFDGKRFNTLGVVGRGLNRAYQAFKGKPISMHSRATPWGSMSHPFLLFCPYLPLSEPVTFADWELGPLESFKNRWADPRFKELATAFLSKFVVGPSDERVSNPALLCRKGQQLDDQPPLPDELRALELSLVFALVDRNPRKRPERTTPEHGRL